MEQTKQENRGSFHDQGSAATGSKWLKKISTNDLEPFRVRGGPSIDEVHVPAPFSPIASVISLPETSRQEACANMATPPYQKPRPRARERSGPREKPWETLDDATLVERALDGDRWAEEALYRRHVRRITGTVMRLLGDRTEAEDVVQETFVRALGELDQLRDESAFGGWLLQIAVRKVHRRFRRRRLRRLLGFTHEGDLPLDSLVSPSASPEERTELQLLARALDSVGGPERTAWALRHIEGHKLKDIAAACGCSLATAKRRIEVAQARIDRHLGRTP